MTCTFRKIDTCVPLARLGNNSAKYNARTFVKSKSEVSLQMNTLQFKNYSGREDTVGNN